MLSAKQQQRQLGKRLALEREVNAVVCLECRSISNATHQLMKSTWAFVVTAGSQTNVRETDKMQKVENTIPILDNPKKEGG